MDTPHIGASPVGRGVKAVGPQRLPVLLLWGGVEPMTPYQSQRIRFGILAAREILERGRLTEWQQDYIEGCELAGWKVGDTRKAFDREWDAAQARNYARKLRP